MQQQYDFSLEHKNQVFMKENPTLSQKIKETSQKINESDKISNKQDQQIYLQMLTPANPIIDKNKSPDQQINFKFIDSGRQNLLNRDKYLNQNLRKSKKLDETIQRPLQTMDLFNGYDLCNLLYRRFDNSEIQQLNKKKYFSSIFSPIFLRPNGKFQLTIQIPPYQGMKNPQKFIQNNSLIQDLQCQMEFNSNFQSGNLFAVFKTGQFQYDLILQNDLNTTGSTQWFYFSVNNKKNKDVMVKFNMVNLYKAGSLYNKGMKPMVLSLKSSKGWKRKGQNIFYEKNCIKRQGSKKYYHSLSFSYDFTKENDTVQFAHTIPYTYTRLLQVLKPLQTSKKCIIKSLGISPLKRNIPIIKFESEDLKIQKKAIIIMARQHPGQVQGSFAIQEILLNLIKNSPESQFLLWRFNFYIIPMINVDGVALGNYRCNSMGYDLNRNWQSEQKSKHPEIVYIKSQIKKIMNKYPIQLILDLHGHSNKMNSFFYGNPFGTNPYVYPYVAAKNNPFITFQDCTFSLQRKQKAKTARSVLGNLIKQTGNVYTYQMSFYGGQKNGKIVNFYQQNFRQLGKQLFTSMYKVYIESYKQQKNLKQSLYLKQIRKEINKIEGEFSQKNYSGSDSQADSERNQIQNQRKQQIQQRMKQFLQQSKGNKNLEDLENLRLSSQLQKSKDSTLMKIQSYSQHKNYMSIQSPIKPRLKRNASLTGKSQLGQTFDYDESLKQKIKKHKIYADKLKVYGQNLLSNNESVHIDRQHQTIQTCQKSIRVSSIFQDKRKQAMNINFAYLSKKHRNRHQNFSTITSSRNQWKQDQGLIHDIVRVNRLDYKKIERQKDALKFKKSIQKHNSKKQGVFKLPSILNEYKV